MTNAKIFQSDKDLTRLDYLNKILIAIGILTISHFLYFFKNSHRETSVLALYFTDAIIGLIFFTWIFTKKVTKEITIDYSTGQFIVNYMTILKRDNYLKLPLTDINFKLYKEPNFRQPQKVTLKILINKLLLMFSD